MSQKKVKIKGELYEVGDYKSEGYVKNKCYFKKTSKYPEGKYYIFRGKLKFAKSFNKVTDEGIYYIAETESYRIKNEDGIEGSDFLSASVDAIYNAPTKEVKKEDKTSKDEKTGSYISPDTSFYKPEPDPEDNLLTSIIKRILQEEDWTSKELSERVSSSIELSNLKRRLVVHKKLSFEGFAKWLYLLKKTGHITIDGVDLDLEYGYKDGNKINVKE